MSNLPNHVDTRPTRGPFYAAGSSTSMEAAASVDPRPLRLQITDLIRGSGTRGMTCSQVEELMPHKTHQSVSARLNELVSDDVIVHEGNEKRKGVSGRKQRVYTLAPAEPEQLNLLAEAS